MIEIGAELPKLSQK